MTSRRELPGPARRRSEQAIGVSHLEDDLAGRSLRGGSLAMAGQGTKFLIQTATTIALARMLMPEDFGLVAMVLVVANFVGLFKDLGLSWATIQRQDLTHGQVSNLFWVNVGMSVALGGLLVLATPLVAAFYGEPRLASIMPPLALSFLFAGLGAQHIALLRRQMRHGLLSLIEVVSMMVAVGSAIAVAVSGGSYWALVVLHVTQFAVKTTLAWLVSGWLPNLPSRGADIRPLLAFGGNVTGFHVLNYFTQQLDKLLLGYIVGATALGYYTKAYNLFQQPMRQLNTPLTSVALPALSRLQDDPAAYRRFYTRAIGLLAYGSMPTVAFLIAAAPALIPLALGEHWESSVRIFQFLAAAGMVTPVLWTAGWVHQSLGRTHRMLRWSLLSDPLYVLSFVIGLQWGGEGVAAAFAVCIWAQWIPTLCYAYRGTAVRLRDVLRAIAGPATIAALILVGGMGTLRSLDLGSDALGLAAAAGMSVALVGSLLTVSGRLRSEVRGMLQLSRHLQTRPSQIGAH